jgi:gamma-glutamylcyclotransferase (GGCT)/AIG2-like uncharacterized protein YtfP
MTSKSDPITATVAYEHDAPRFRPPKRAYVLLYGSLCRNQPAHKELGLDRSLRFVGLRTVPGTLYDLGDYPGLVAGTGTVRAELYRIDDASILPRLDAFEGYDQASPSASPYRRAVLRVPRCSQRWLPWLARRWTVAAWIFLYNGPVEGRPRIAAASWADYQAERCLSSGRPAAGGGSR